MWFTNGTPIGTERLTDINAGGAGSLVGRVVSTGSSLIFPAFDPSEGMELWQSDLQSTNFVTLIRSGSVGSLPGDLTVSGGNVLLADPGSGGRQLFVVDTTAGTAATLDRAGLILSETNFSITEGSTNGTLGIRLATQPTADVTVTMQVDSELVLSTTSLTFTPTNWDVPQDVMVSVVDNLIPDGQRVRTISHQFSSVDPIYDSIAVMNTTVTVVDDDAASVLLTPLGRFKQRKPVAPSSLNWS